MSRLIDGPVSDVDVDTLADLLHETADHHGAFEAVTPPHNWWDWYAPYLLARLHSHTMEEATWAADLRMKGLGIVRGSVGVGGAPDADATS